MSELTEKIRSRGHWDVVIRPKKFDKDRVPYSELDDIIQSAVVRMRGWPVPMFDLRQPPIRADQWIGQDVNADVTGHYEAWRFYTSGQFNHLRGVGADWRHEAKIAPAPPPQTKVIEVWEILFYLTEVFELAARLALSKAGDEEMTVSVDLRGLKDRSLIVGQSNRSEFFEPYHTHQDELHQEITASQEDIVANPRGNAVDMAGEFFAPFGWKPPREQLLDHQGELTDKA